MSGRTPFSFSKLTNLAGYSIDISPLEGLTPRDDNFGTRVAQIDRTRFSLVELMGEDKTESKEKEDEKKENAMPPRIPLNSIQPQGFVRN